VVRYISSIVILLFSTSCTITILPSSNEIHDSPWKTFSDAQTAYNQINPTETTLSELKKMGFDPFVTSNITILSYLDIIRHFMPNNSIGLKDLPAEVRDCIKVQDKCNGYQIRPSVIRSIRVGNPALDLLNFKRVTHKTGWSFSALVLLQDDVVTYKVWRGTPIIDIKSQTNNPLGPIQDPASTIRGQLPF